MSTHLLIKVKRDSTYSVSVSLSFHERAGIDVYKRQAVWGYVVPLSIPLLLLQCDMRKIGKESGRILIIFLIGSVGTACGALLAYAALHKFIPELAGLAGVFLSLIHI